MFNFITSLSISNCCIDNNCINNILKKMSSLRVLKIGINKFDNPMLDSPNIENYELVNIYSSLYLNDQYVYKTVLDFEYDVKNHIYNFDDIAYTGINNIYSIAPLEYIHDNIIDEIKLVQFSHITIDSGIVPIKYYSELKGHITNIMNNVIGDILLAEKGDSNILLPLKELYIHNTHNLKYINVIPLLMMTKLDILSLNITTTESISSLLEFKIPTIEIINESLTFQNIIENIISIDIKKLELNISHNRHNNKMKINIILTSIENDIENKLIFTFWDNGINIPYFQQILNACRNIIELKINKFFTLSVIKKCGIHFNYLKKIKILNDYALYHAIEYDEYEIGTIYDGY
jgi:hypothetical protein